MVDLGTHARAAAFDSNNKDQDGEALCVNKQGSHAFEWGYGYLMQRLESSGWMTPDKMIQACKQFHQEAKPVCDSAHDADGQCSIVGGVWKWSNPTDVVKYKAPIEKIVGAYFYARPALRMNRGDKSQVAESNVDKNGDVFCATRTSAFVSKLAWRNLIIERVPVSGKMKSSNLVTACNNLNLKPICDHANSADGKCVIAAGEDWYISNPAQSKAAGRDVPRPLVQGTFIYNPGNGDRSSLDEGDQSRWSTNDDENGDTLCSEYNHAVSNFTWNNFLFVRTKVQGDMTGANILAACDQLNMKPACDKKSYADDRCEVVSGTWHLSNAPKAFSLPKQKMLGAYFYCGTAMGGLTLLNTGLTHKWSGTYNQNSGHRTVTDRNGDTFCAKKQRSAPVSTSWGGVELHRIAVQGEMNSENIVTACDSRDMVPLCAAAKYADGRCYMLSGRDWHFSKPQDTRGKGLTRKLLHNSFFYAGNQKSTLNSLMDTGKDHRWSTEKDKNEDTVCIKDTRKKGDRDFEFQGYKFKRVKVDGVMTSTNLFKACLKDDPDSRPPCEYSHDFDSMCQMVAGNWHLSDPEKITEYNLPLQKIQGAYFYAAKAKTGRAPNKEGLAIMNTGMSTKWASQNVDGSVWDRDGDTFCVARMQSFPEEWAYKDYNFVRVRVKGIMNSSNIVKACTEQSVVSGSLRPVCNSANYADGQCVIAGIGDWHVSDPTASKANAIKQRLITQGVFTYCGWHNGERALVDLVDKSRWSYIEADKANHEVDKDGETLCSTETSKGDKFEFNKWNFERVTVEGTMISSNILKACQDRKMHPVCDHDKYADGLCRKVGGEWHFSHPTDAQKEKVPQDIILGAYFYCGNENGGKALLNNGLTHRWSHTVHGKIWDKNGDTFCVSRSEKFPVEYVIGEEKKKIIRVKTDGITTGQSIIDACKAKEMLPVCNGPQYSDGRCVLIAPECFTCINNKPNPEDDRLLAGELLKGDVTRGVYMYSAMGNNYNGMALLDAYHENRWSSQLDKHGDTFCTKPLEGNFEYEFYEFYRTKVEGEMNPENALKACKDVCKECKPKDELRPVCNSANDADGQCRLVGGKWSFSDPDAAKSQVNVFQIAGAYFYTPKKLLANVLSQSREVLMTKDNKIWDQGGDTYCVKRGKNFVTSAEWRNYQIKREHVNGRMDSDNIYAACAMLGMRPVCNSLKVNDGRCIAIDGNGKLSDVEHHKKHKEQPALHKTMLQGAFTYAGKGESSILETAGGEKKIQFGDATAGVTAKNGDTLCVEVHPDEDKFEFNKYIFHKIKVEGPMTGFNIFDACKAKNQTYRPACEHADFADGRCRIAGGAWHLAMIEDQKSYGLDPLKLRNTYFYAGNYCGKKLANEKCDHSQSLTIYSTGVETPDHEWSKKGVDEDGFTYCVERPASVPSQTKWDGHTLHRVPVASGQMDSKNIIGACAKRHMRPVCNHINDADGECVVVGGDWHLSDPAVTPTKKDINGSGIPRHLLLGVYMYSGDTNNGFSRLDMASKHRWSTPNDEYGDTLCTPTNYNASWFEFNDYEFYRVKVDGYMTSKNIHKTCADAGMRPVCDRGKSADGECRIVGGDNWRFSHFKEAQQHGVPTAKVKGAYFYTGAENCDPQSPDNDCLSSMNNGVSHQWSKTGRDRNGDTFCVKRAKSFKHEFRWHNHTMERVPVIAPTGKKCDEINVKLNKPVGTECQSYMRSDQILEACAEKGMRPVCNNAVYADGKCIIVGGEWHMSLEDHTKGRDLPRSFLRGTFTYAGDANNGWSYLDTGTSHRWSRSTDHNGDTLCVRPDRQDKIFVRGDWQFLRVEVKRLKRESNSDQDTDATEFMTSTNILKTCQALHMKPVCESKEYCDDRGRAIGSWHLSYPEEAKKNLPAEYQKLKGAYFYLGENRDGGRTLMNNGVKHVWSKDNVDAYGDTYCVQHTSMMGHGECNCPSVNSLMVRADQIKKICAEKRAKENNQSNSTNSSEPETMLGEDDNRGEDEDEDEDAHDPHMRSHMARIAKAATVDPSPRLGETLFSTERGACEGKCGDVRGLVRQIYRREKACGLLDLDLDNPHEEE
jgi:hypothetical protein